MEQKPNPKTKERKRGGKSKAGRPSIFTQEVQKTLILMARRGFTDAEMAQCLRVTAKTFDNWKAKNNKFFTDLKDAKFIADQNVENALYERACGYEHPDTKPQWVETSELDPESGKIVKSGRWEYAEMIKHYPPDATSMIFWLKNRQPDKWRDKQDLDITDNRMIKAILEAMPAEVSDLVRQAIKDKAKK